MGACRVRFDNYTRGVIFIDINEGSILTGRMLCVIWCLSKTVSTMLEIRNEDECVCLDLNLK